MLRRYLLSIVLAACTAGCGRVGVGLVPLDSAPSADAGLAADGGSDAGTPSDASLPAPRPIDAGVSADAGQPASDAGHAADSGTSADASPPPPSCAGNATLGICWYLGAGSSSCNDACKSHGGFDSRAIGEVGTTKQGGSLAACSQIMKALGQAGSVGTATRSDQSGFGCHLWPGGTLYWLDDPSPLFSPSVASSSNTPVRIACGCVR
jgi:hypothetical protein